jgi:hypothetical protein
MTIASPEKPGRHPPGANLSTGLAKGKDSFMIPCDRALPKQYALAAMGLLGSGGRPDVKDSARTLSRLVKLLKII